MPTLPDPAPDRWLSREDLRDRFHISLSNMQLRRWERTNRFPPRQHRAEGERWSEQRVLAWLQQQGTGTDRGDA